MFYNARWYDSQLGRFTQADSIVPGGVQGYDRYAYVNNNPLRYTDPTGHWTMPPGWANPFSYDILSAGVMFNLKDVPGVEISLVAHFNWGAIKDAVLEMDPEYLKEADFSLNLEATGSVGLSLETDAEVFLQGSNGTVEDQSGLSLISTKNVPINAGACLPSGVCGKATADLDFENQTINSIGYQVGVGEGVDISADIFSVSFPLYSGNIFTNKYKGPSLKDFIDEVFEDISEYGE